MAQLQRTEQLGARKAAWKTPLGVVPLQKMLNFY